MTTRADLLALADRVEREEPTPALAMQVIAACGWSRPNGPRENRWHHPIHGWRDGGPDPLHSLDAAASLVPSEAIWWEVYYEREWRYGPTRAEIALNLKPKIVVRGIASSPAAALTAAALRARAQEIDDDR